jgi:hypothetical protein
LQKRLTQGQLLLIAKTTCLKNKNEGKPDIDNFVVSRNARNARNLQEIIKNDKISVSLLLLPLKEEIR